MISSEDLIELVRNYNPRTNATLIRQAYDYGAAMHEGQLRHSGEPYFTHPVSVAAILTEQRLDDATIVTALLHDTVEDTRSTYSEVARLFGTEIADLVDGVTKLTNIEVSSRETKQAENVRKLIVAMSRDLRVILVKLADRLHNMRTIGHMRPEKQIQKARETMDIYAPLAERMGMQSIREELEDLSFRVVNPDARASIIRRFLTLQRATGDVVHKITADMRAELERAELDAEVFGRAKRPYSIWRKMERKQQGFSRLSDIYGFRVITQSEDDCYRALGVIHRRWKVIPTRFKDYISEPKENGYRSIHTTVSGRDGKVVEVQIRTRSMHDVAETGVAAHWSYRDGVRSENPFAVDPARWIATLNERFEGDLDHGSFLDTLKLEMYADKVFCFTPKGDVVKLPRGATPIDFAYKVATGLGHACVGARINGERVPLWTRLKNGQQVEIIKAEGQVPQSSWLEVATTGHAKAAIRRQLRELDRERAARLGQELARQVMEHVGKKLTDKAMEIAANGLGLPDAFSVYSALGAAEITGSQLLRAVYPELNPPGDEIDAARPVLQLDPGEGHRAQCCQPLPGERIIGVTMPGQGVFIHAADCDDLAKYEDKTGRWLDLHWTPGTHPVVHTVTLDATIAHAAGVLGRVCTLIGAQGANIADLKFRDQKPDFYRLTIDIDLRDREHLHGVMTALETESDVAAIERVRDLGRAPVEIRVDD